MLNIRCTTHLPLLVLLAGAVGLGGCPFLDDFPRVAPGGGDDDGPGDDDTDPDDDDDTAPGDREPEVTIDGIDPMTIPISGQITIQYTVSDPDSDGYRLESNWLDSAGVKRPTTLVGGTGAAFNEFEEVVAGAPPLNQSGGLSWNSVQDVPTTAGGVTLELCVWDSEDNVGNCDTYPETGGLSLQNTLESGLGAFCQPGHLEVMNWLGGRAVVPLSDGSCLNYQKTEPPLESDFAAQFLLVMVNDTASEMAFTISATDQPTILGPPTIERDAFGALPSRSGLDDDVSDVGFRPAPSDMLDAQDGLAMADLSDELRRAALQNMDLGRDRWAAPSILCTEDVFASDVNQDDRTFFFREGISAEADREARGADLLALGDHIAIYVDDETPIDFDEDCSDPNNDPIESPLPAFGFTNCDLEGIVDIVEDNIWPTLTGLFGEPSDVDANCRVTIFLSHRLNRLTDQDEDPTNDAFTVRSFAEPNVDLWQSNLTANPNSNEQEMLFVYAPDPVGFWSEPVALEDYLSYELAGAIAIGLFDLISYAQHRTVGKQLLDKTSPADLALPAQEEDWLNDALGLLAADLTGFGSIAFQDAWVYMDRPHLLKLEEANTLADFEDRGGQYLFARYLHDLYGDGAVGIDMYSLLMDSGCIGSDNVSNLVAAAASAAGGDDDDSAGDDDDSAGGGGGGDCSGASDEIFETFILQWATAMAVSGRTIGAGGPQLVPDTVITNYQTASVVAVQDPLNPQPGELFGANGFQQGFNVRDLNHTYIDGTDPAGPIQLSNLDVRTGNLDNLLFHPQSSFFGTVEGNFGVVAVLVSGLEQPENYLLIETAVGEPLLGHVIRLNDSSPHDPRLTLEDVDGAKITTVRELGSLELFEERNAIGRIDTSELIIPSAVVSPPERGDDDDDDDAGADDDDSAGDDEESDVEVTDTDRFSFSLSGQQLVGIWVDRRISSLAGDAELADPFIAVMPIDDVPDAFDYGQWGFGPVTGPCYDPLDPQASANIYNYPLTMPFWLGLQANLISDPVDVPSDFDPQGYVPGSDSGPEATYECLYDHDQDGIADVEEPGPENLVDQIRLRQGENLAIDADAYLGTFDDLVLPAVALDVSVPFFGANFIDKDSNESPDNDFVTNVKEHNIGGRQVKEGEEAVWSGYLPAGEYMIIVGDGSGGEGAYDLSVRTLVPPAP